MITAEGKIKRLRVLETSGDIAANEAAVNAAWRTYWEPALVDGEPVEQKPTRRFTFEP